MNNIFLFLCLICSSCICSQERPISSKNVFFSFEGNLGYDLADIVSKSLKDYDPEDINSDYYDPEAKKAGRFNTGVSANLGFQVFERFSLAAGLRYSYVTPNFHLMYATGQTNIFFGHLDQDEKNYIFIRGGGLINQSVISKGWFMGAGFGSSSLINKNIGQYYNVYLEGQDLGSGTLFIGLTYGIMFIKSKK